MVAFGIAVAVCTACGLDVVGSRPLDDGAGNRDSSVPTGAPDGHAEAGPADDGSSDSETTDASVDSALDAGPAGLALAFDGDDFVRVARQVQGDFTLEAWIKTTSSRGGSNFWDGLGIIYADVAGMAADFGTSVLNGKFAFGTSNTTIQSVTSINTGNWEHVAAVRIATGGNMFVYVNGVPEVAATGATSVPLTDSSSIDIGGNTIDKRFFKGKIDEVRIWNLARTSVEIQTSMKLRLAGNEPGLVGYWRFDDGSGNVAIDSSPNANVGDLGNGDVGARPSWVSSGAF